jgi:hypothetical protein
MNAADLITTLQAEGLRLGLDDTGTLRCYGDRDKVSAYLPIIREHKTALLRLLAEKPAAPDEDQGAFAGAQPQPPDDVGADLEPTDRCEFWDGFDDKAAGIAVLHSRIVTRVLAGEMELPQ